MAGKHHGKANVFMNVNDRSKIAIIGGGASGMMAALVAARGGATVTIYEHMDRIGKKILMTGNGKCNFSNLSFSDKDYYTNNTDLIKSVFEQFSNQDAMNFFVKNGVLVKEKNQYLYPLTEQASTILDLFRRELEQSGVTIHTSYEVTKIVVMKDRSASGQEQNLFKIQDDPTVYQKVIIACGGKAAPKSGSDGSGYRLAQTLGHEVIQPLPALVQLRSSESYFKAIAGVRTEAILKLCVEGKVITEESGELQLTDYGISGIPVFQLSGLAAMALSEKKRVEVIIDFIPSVSKEDLKEYVTEQGMRFQNAEVPPLLEEILQGLMNKKIVMMLMKQSGMKADTKINQLTPLELDKLLGRIKKWYVKITNTNPFANAQVCRGGIDCMQVSHSCESLLIPGIYFTGEILNVDGRCGGYNLQWAWSSGVVAGLHACQSMQKR